MAVPRIRIPPAALLAGALGGLAVLTLLAAYRFGPAALALPAALAVGAAVMHRVELGLAALLGLAVLAENSDDVVPPTDRLYDAIVPLLAPFDLALLAVVAAVLLDCARRRELPRLPHPFVPALALMVVAVLCGAVMGYYGGGSPREIAATSFGPLFLVITPILVVTVVRTPEQVRRLLMALTALVAVRAAVGIAAVFAGAAPAELGGTQITFLAPTMNFLTVLVVVAGVVAVVRGVRPSPWLLLAWALCLASLVLSYRRSFWIVAVLAIVLAVVFGFSRLQRRLAVPALVLVGLGVWLVLSTGIATSVQGPLVERAESLSPERIAVNRTDTYRIDERRNVVADLGRHPLGGLGMGVPWTARYPLGIEYENGRQYTHVAVLWFWMKLGILGPLAYLGVVLTGVVVALRAGRRLVDPWPATFAIALAGALLALLVGELTATFTGADRRFTVVLGALLGFAAVLRAQTREEPAR